MLKRLNFGVHLPFCGADFTPFEFCPACLESFAVFGGAPGDSFSPHSEAGGFHLLAHELDDIGFGKSGLFLDLVEGAAIFPCHTDDLVALLLCHRGEVKMDFRGRICFLTMNRETKICASCGRVISWRKKWEDCWDEVRYCSAGCRKKKGSKEDSELELAILALLGRRARGATACPSEVALEFFGENEWRDGMERVRCAARRLVDAGKLEILQKGRAVDASTAKGAIRLRRIF